VENKKHVFKPCGKIQEALGRVAVFADSAHSLGASRNGKMAGEIADFSSFSFHAVKNFTTAEGGAATWRSMEGIDDEELYQQYQLYSLHGQSKDAFAKSEAGEWEYDIVGPWYKCNMTDIMAAIGLKQFERYPSMLQKRREIIEAYDVMCEELHVQRLQHYGEDFQSSGHLYLVRIPNITVEQRNEIIAEMAKRGITCNVHYKPLPMMTAYKELGWDIQDFPNAYDYYHNLITLPLYSKLTSEEVEYIVKHFTEIVKKYI
jgi:dTDP-4-amino-4,6-dideoxygalactose transaminase